jgi:hypothetical protein
MNPEYLVAVQRNFYRFTSGSALQLGTDLGRQDRIDPVDIRQPKLERGQYLAGLLVLEQGDS